MDDAYSTCTFRYLAMGMKDKHALDIVVSLHLAGLPNAFAALEQFCCDELNEKDEDDG